MSLYSRYEIVAPVAEPQVRTFEARDIASGRRVWVHVILGGEGGGVLRKVANVPPAARAAIIEIGEQDGNPFIVTDDLGGSLLAWLDAQISAKPATGGGVGAAEPKPAEPKAAPPVVPAREPGDFTRMFGGSPGERGAGSGEPVRATGPGEFTRMFKGAAPDAEGPGAGNATEAIGATGNRPAAGEFTRMFEGSVPGAGAQSPGDASKLFGAAESRPAEGEFSGIPERSEPEPAARGARPDAAHTPGNTAEPPRAASSRPAAGDFTQMFNDAESRPARASSGEITEAFRGGSATPDFAPPRRRPAAPLESELPGKDTRPNPLDVIEGWNETSCVAPPAVQHRPIPAAAPAPLPQGPSEYTRVVLAGSSSNPGSAVPAAAPVVPRNEPAWKPYLPALIVLGCLVILAILLIVFFSLRS